MFKLVKKVIFSIFKAVYAVLSLFNLQLTVLLALVGVILFFTGVFEKTPVVRILYVIAFIFSVLLAIYLTIRKLLGLDKKKKKDSRRKPEIVETKEGEQIVATETSSSQTTQTPVQKINYPIYYTVKQNKDYIMAEYEDRYELYFKDRYGLKKIRTDYKN